MQLNDADSMLARPGRTGRKRRIAASLAAATCTLLGAGAETPLVAGPEKPWSFDTGLLYYGERDRVTDASATVTASRLFSRGRRLVLKLSVDSLTGASASGAVPANTPQTFTTPSGRKTYSTPAGETPLDDTFLDTRVALAANWVQPLGLRTTADFGLSASNEYDYFHAGANARLTRDFNQRNTSLTLGFALGIDSVQPVGGAPVPLARMQPPGDPASKLGDDDKTVADLFVGVSQVLGRRTIGQLNYTYSRSDGYLNDPYKIVSVIDPATGVPAPGPDMLNDYRYESRPDTRSRHALWAEIRRAIRDDVLNVVYRYGTDDWGIDSHTGELRYRFRFQRFYVQPHLRYYTQGAADFYVRALADGAPLPEHASADYRIGELDTMTYGLKVGVPLGDDREWSLRVEYYEQAGRGPPGQNTVTALDDLDLFPTVEALIVQGGYRF